LLIAMGSVANAVGYLAESITITAAASSLLLVGVLVVVVGTILVATLSTSSWQKFARHSSFGDEPALSGHELWSAGDFSAWSATREGYERQIRVLTTMLCGYKVYGIGFSAQTIAVRFGAIPPGAQLEARFDIKYANGIRYHPSYTIDLQT